VAPAADAGELAGLTPKKRGRKKAEVDVRDRKIVELQRENTRLTARAERAEALVDLQKKVAALLGRRWKATSRDGSVMETGSKIGVAPACLALGLPRATYYRRLRPKPVDADGDMPSRPQPRALPPEERQQVLAVLNEPRFMDLAPPQVHATLLDEGRWLCSLRTMYRILDENGQVHERRNQLRHPEYKKPELLATRPNQVWTWDITKLLGPANGPTSTCT